MHDKIKHKVNSVLHPETILMSSLKGSVQRKMKGGIGLMR